MQAGSTASPPSTITSAPCRTLRAISEKLVKQDPGNAIWQGDLAWVYWQTGSAWAQAEPNSKNEARAMMEKGRDILRQLKEGRRLTANMQKWLDSIEVDLWKMQENK
jgi:hypothetical protein